MPWRWLALSAVAVFAVIGGPRLSFEKDLRQLNAQPKKGTGIAYGSATGRCSKSVVLVAETAEDLDTAVGGRDMEPVDGEKGVAHAHSLRLRRGLALRE